MQRSEAAEEAIRHALAEARSELGVEVAFFAEFAEGRLVFRALDGAAEAFGWTEGGGLPLEDTFCARMVCERLPTVIPDTRTHPEARTVPAARTVGSYVGVPVLRPDGSLYGSFCCLGREANPELEESAGRVLRLLARLVSRQIGQASRAADEIRVSEERLADAQRIAGMGSFTWESDDDTVRWSEQLAAMLALRAGDRRTALHDYLDRVHPGDRDRVGGLLHGFGAEVDRLDYEHRALWPDGTEGVVHVRGEAELDGTGAVVRVAGTVQDVTEQRRAEADQRARAAADRANQAKSEFLSRVSHELRTPLTAVLGFTQLMQLDGLSPAQQESAVQILKAGEHLLALIDEVLELTQIETNALRVALAPVALAPLAEEVAELLAPLAAESGVRIAVTGTGGSALADARRLRQVLLNLGANAVKFNRPGGRMTLAVGPATDGRAALAVSDTGPGLAPEQLARLFRPFERLDAEVRGIAGTGLGLALSKALVEAMGGEIAVVSAPGQGSTFTVRLPAASPAGGLAPDPPPRPEAARERRPRRRVLCAEDHPDLLVLIRRILDLRPDLELVTARGGAEALALAAAEPPALVLLDLHLGDLPGEEVLRALRADPATAEVPVLVLSADVSPARRERLLAAGARAYLTKPIDIPLLLETLDGVLA